jgi:hypothetical protein
MIVWTRIATAALEGRGLSKFCGGLDVSDMETPIRARSQGTTLIRETFYNVADGGNFEFQEKLDVWHKPLRPYGSTCFR